MTSLILASVGVFLGVILLLVIILLIAKRYLSPSGKVKVTINGEKEVEVEVGSSLLSTLAENKIFLPSACGGGGSCAQCRCQVEAGGGEILPTEKVHFSRKEQQANWRLGCQVKVKQDMEIKVPEAVLGVKKWECEVVSNNNVATFIKEFVVRLPKGEHLNFVSGGYIQIDIPKYDIKYADYEIEDRFRGDWDKFKMWDLTCKNEEETMRAYSMANYPAEGDIVMLNVRIATPPFDRVNGGFMNVPPGISSSYIFSLKPGDKVMVSGPFGEFHPILDSGREMLYVGGGAGMAPLRSHILHLLKTLKITDRKISYWYGARSKNEIFYEEDFRELEREFPNFSFHIALSDPLPEDNWTGPVGFIHNVILNNYLKDHEAPEDVEYYMCGPGPMAKAVEKMLYDLGVPRNMLMFDDFGA
ncbi:MAG: NADH:ubiquinone reductase (Na(+)-transporting) subunit F [Bacteroides graminisolvens]|jgi:Na+-transporting NADH:ubiquinone oxidoreductase subunit F|uniref:Na(+)-translocating NADH-quinone reductase subunit F n=2 Tax=Bacteroides graminisolvens TaxID=477666 RepID=A0A069CZW9_9BACE|nr:NADH:ubiquinone reductase (Na(+)-transporting) subunit F [Bacteroides graminisolvens]MBP6140148.1 NADH:ubiquinone reductase (Na(+)-transporting) subunit F [Bacteroides sp.]MBP6248528.1 NADH:ubiquinone reductase (Na(+)-transporting) subunit F [Bacteroides sp.]MBP7293324.1 NADH:ubiquinone reductase (Na(+)-transporting) subunit F [Bacteroides sp.]MBP9720387.1 NADH:ubiquinone reductase (Na(+)-transporting) subunit F [Bacteroides sp.]MCD8556432.1 NADH:ubiquinone reductase (Na(+)-transporting) su